MNNEDSRYLPARRLGFEPEGERLPVMRRAPYVEVKAERSDDADLRWGTLDDYLNSLMRRKWLIVSCMIAGALIGLAVMIRQPLLYRSQTSLEIQGFNESFMRMNEVDPQASAGIYSANAVNILTQVRILNSDTLRRSVIEKLERETIPSLPPMGTGTALLFNRLRRALGFSPDQPSAALRSALEEASQSVRAVAAEGTRVVEISCESSHPEIAAEYVNALVNEFIEQGLSSRTKNYQRTSQWLTQQLDEQKLKLEEAENRLKEFVSGSGVLGLTQDDARSTLAESKLAQLQSELAAIQADRIVKQSRYETARSRGVEALPEFMQASSLPSLSASLAGLRQQAAQLLSTLTPAHYKVKRVQAQIAEVESAIAREKKNLLARIRNEYETALQREKMLAAAYSSQSHSVIAQGDKATQHSLLRREVDTNRQLYNAMLQQVNQAGIASAIPTNNIRVIDIAVPSGKPSYRQLYIACGLGTLTGLLFGGVVAVLWQQLDRRVNLPGQLSGILNVPELGVIPSGNAFDDVEDTPLRVAGVDLGRLRRKSRTNGTRAAMKDGHEDFRIELVTHQQKPSMLAESFRATLVSILFSPESSKRRVLAVTSPNPREGKSTMASNLAIALAEVHRRVILIDGDLHKPSLHAVFNLANTWGLSDILTETIAIDQYPADSLARPTEVPGVYVLTSGPAVIAASSILYSERMSRLIERLRGEFDYVLIDTPPMMVLPDARILGQLSEGVILVFRAGTTSSEDVRTVGKRLAEDGTTILGTVLNDWKPRASGRGSYYYRHYNNYYVNKV